VSNVIVATIGVAGAARRAPAIAAAISPRSDIVSIQNRSTRPDGPGGGLDLLVGGIQTAEPDVLLDRAVEQERVLQDDPHLPAEAGLGHRPEVDPIDPHRAFGRVVEA
jgi:hypothetical protein